MKNLNSLTFPLEKLGLQSTRSLTCAPGRCTCSKKSQHTVAPRSRREIPPPSLPARFLLDDGWSEWCQCGAPGSQSSAGSQWSSVQRAGCTTQQCGRGRAKTRGIVRFSLVSRRLGGSLGPKASLSRDNVSKTKQERTLPGLEAAPGRIFSRENPHP